MSIIINYYIITYKSFFKSTFRTFKCMRALQQELERIANSELESTVYADYNEQYQSFVLIALLLLVIEFFILSRKNHRLTRMDLFGEKTEKWKRKTEM